MKISPIKKICCTPTDVFRNQADFYPCTEFLLKFRPNRRKSSTKETMNYNITHDTCRYLRRCHLSQPLLKARERATVEN